MPDLQGEDIVRVLRVLEYVGPRRAVEHTMQHNAVKGVRVAGDLTIREAVIGDWPEILPVPITDGFDPAPREGGEA